MASKYADLQKEEWLRNNHASVSFELNENSSYEGKVVTLTYYVPVSVLGRNGVTHPAVRARRQYWWPRDYNLDAVIEAAMDRERE